MLDLYQQPPNKYKSVGGFTWNGAFPTPDTIGNQGSPTRNFIKQGVGTFTTGTGPNAINDMVAQNLLARHDPVQAQAMAMWKAQHGASGYGGYSPPSNLPGATQGGGGHQSFGFGNQDAHSAERFGNAPGTMALPSMPSAASGINPFQYSADAASNLYPGLQQSPFNQALQRSQPQNMPFQSNADMGNFPGGQPSPSNPWQKNDDDFDKIAGRATGGPVKQVQPYIVGEKGPELFIPKESGEIIPHKDVKKYMFKALQGRQYGGNTQGSGYMTYRMPVQQPQMGSWMPNQGYGQMQQYGQQQPYGYGQQQGYYPPQMQYPQGFNPYAASFLPQFLPQQQQMTPEMQGIASSPDAPDNPMAMARYIRMGLQANARRKMADEEGRARVAQIKAQWAASGVTDQRGQPIYNPGSTGAGDISPAYRGPSGLNMQTLTSPYGTGSVTLGPPGSTPHGTFGPNNLPMGEPSLNIDGIPNMNAGRAMGSDPNAVTFQQADLMDQLKSSKYKPSPLASLLGAPK